MKNDIRLLNSSEAVETAIKECDSLGRVHFLKKYGYKKSRRYLLLFNGKQYDSKAIVGVAFGIQHGISLTPYDFSGGIERVVPLLVGLGFTVDTLLHPAEVLVIGKTYQRNDLLQKFGGQLQAGIWTPKEFPVVFIFSGDSGKAFGYEDRWTEEGIFQYTGGGQAGDMAFTFGNKAIRDHRINGKDLLLFEDNGKGKGVRYAGLFDCADWEIHDGIDKDKRLRKIIVYNLVKVETGLLSINTSTSEKQPLAGLTLAELRAAAIDAANGVKTNAKFSGARKRWYERSEKVRMYVLARANGTCEACDITAPFKRKDGSPYLEPHHTKRLADEGPDHPAWVGAICPNCHRRVHSGEDAKEWNDRLKVKIFEKENS
jgi:5-methylcytosine-specific restriction protein A